MIFCPKSLTTTSRACTGLADILSKLVMNRMSTLRAISLLQCHGSEMIVAINYDSKISVYASVEVAARGYSSALEEGPWEENL